jgi:hypothetical protein
LLAFTQACSNPRPQGTARFRSRGLAQKEQIGGNPARAFSAFDQICSARLIFVTRAGNEKIVMKKLLAIVALATVAAFTANPVFAAVRHHNRAPERPAVERLNRSNLYQSDAQGNQPYPNPDRELCVPGGPW